LQNRIAIEIAFIERGEFVVFAEVGDGGHVGMYKNRKPYYPPDRFLPEGES
jgi:hypothetical protein